MPENLLGGQGATLLTAIIIVAVALLALVGVFWLIRNRASSTFIRGGKNRQPRLAVLDATAVDTRRRLVLIRRDDVEHLVMIGGPTDIVIESRIPQTDRVRVPHQADLATPPPMPPQQQRMAPSAPTAARPAPQQARAAAPARPPAQSDAPTIDRSPRQSETAAQSPAQSQQPLSAPALAATAATIGATATIRTEAADLLESARTRVFEEPDFDDSNLDDLMAVPPSPVQTASVAAPSRSAPASPSPAPSTRAPAVTTTADPIQAEAANVLENARTRVFEEPTFDESAFDELTAAPAAEELTRPAAATSRAPAAAPESTSPATPASSDFEAVLAAELSDDLTLGSPQDSFLAAHYNEHQLEPEEAEQLEAPDVEPEPQPSRDSLEAEMERLLGDLSRKP